MRSTLWIAVAMAVLARPTLAGPSAKANGVESYDPDGDYPVHIFTEPDEEAGKRIASGTASVLILGTGSTADVVADARKLVNPATGKPYDVIIGLANRGTFSDLTSRVRRDHVSSVENARAINSAIVKQFKRPLDVKSIDMHSNGVSVGVAAIEQGAFRKVENLQLMGPDVGYGGRNLEAGRIATLAKKHGVTSIDVHVNQGDIVPKLTAWSKTLVDAATMPPTAAVMHLVEKVTARKSLVEAAAVEGSIIHYHEYTLAQNTVSPLEEHFVVGYVAQRASQKHDPALIEATRERMGRDEYDRAVAPPNATATQPSFVDDRTVQAIVNAAIELGPKAVAALREAADVAVPAAVQAALPSSIVGDELVGGVSLRFDQLGPGAAPDGARILAVLAARAGKPGRSFLVPGATRKLELTAVSVRTLLASEATTLGNLTRVFGYVVQGADLLLLGEAAPGAPTISIDVLAAAVQAVWRDGRSPYVSLDPDPANFSGPQKVRTGDLPPALAKTELVQILLDADYQMKRINLGEDRPDAPGFLSSYELHTRRTGAEGEVLSRFWLTPVQSGPAEIQEAAGANSRAVVFDSRVQVLTERLKRVGDFLAGAGEVDPLAEEAARQLTVHYDALSAQYPIFHRLAAVFDVAKLCAVLRAQQVTHPVLDELAARSVAAVTVRESYDGIGPKPVRGTQLVVSGGATAKYRVRRAAFGPGELAAVLDARPGQELTVALSAAVDLDATRAREVDAELRLSRGIAAFGDLDYARADEILSRVVTDDPDLPEARIYRGLSRFALGDVAAARTDVEASLGASPELQGMRALVAAYMGDGARALADAAAAERAFPEDEAVLGWCAQARVFAFDLPGAEITNERLLALNPLDPDALTVRTLIDLLYRLGPRKAERRVVDMRAVPLPIMQSLDAGGMAIRRFDFEGAVASFDRCLALVDKAGGHPGAAAYHIRERCAIGAWMALDKHAVVLAKLDAGASEQLKARAAELAGELVRSHADWPTGYLLQAQHSADPTSGMALFEQALGANRAADPVLDDLGIMLGSGDRALAFVGLMVWYRMEDKGSREAMRLLGMIEPLLPSVARRIVKAFRDVDAMRPTAAVARLRETERDLPAAVPTDPTSLWTIGYFYVFLFGVEEKLGDVDKGRAAALRFLARTSGIEGLGGDVLAQLAAIRLDLVSGIAMTYKEHLAGHPRAKALMDRVAGGQIPEPAEVTATLDSIRTEIAEQAGPGGRIAVAFVNDTLQQAQRRLETEMLEQAESVAPADDRTRRWRNAHQAADARPAKLEHMRRGYQAMIEASGTAVDLRTVALLIEVMQKSVTMMASADVPPEDAAIAAEMSAVLSSFAPGLKRPVAPPSTHAWDSWASTSAASGGTSGGGRGAMLPIAGALGAMAVLLAIAVVVRRRRHRATTGDTI